MASVVATVEESNRDDDGRPGSVASYTKFGPTTENLKFVVEKTIHISSRQDLQTSHNLSTDGDRGAKEQSVWHRIFKSRCCMYTDIALTVLIIVLVWMMMALPTVIYVKTHLERDSKAITEGKDEASVHSDTNINVTCTLYNGSDSDYCSTYLQQYTNCLRHSPNDTAMYILGPLTPKIVEEVNQTIIALRSGFLSTKCLKELESFICPYHIQLCDKDLSNDPIAPSINQCSRVYEVCDQEIKLFKTYVDINKYKNIMSMCAAESQLDSMNCSIRNRTVNTCNNDFFYEVEKNACKPECGVWTPYSRTTVLVVKLLTILPPVISVIAGVVVLLTSLVHHKKLCRYPSIFVIYQTIPAVVLALLVLAGVSAQKKLFCRSRNLIETFFKPTPFCTISGIILYYILIQLLLWFLWHTIAVFLSVTWPQHAKKLIKSKKHRYLHITFVLASLILPTAPVLIVMFASSEHAVKLGFTLPQSPLILCTGIDLHSNFWGVLFPMSILLAIGTSLLVLVLRVVLKKHLLSKVYKIRMISGWTLEFKVLLVLFYYGIIGAVVLTIFTHNLFVVSTSRDVFLKYFSCEEDGLLPHSNKSRCSHLESRIQGIMNPVPTTVVVVILALLPAVNMVYVVSFADLKQKMKTYSQTRYVQYLQRGANRAGRYIPYLINEWKSTTFRRGSHKTHTNSFTTEPLITPQVNPDSCC